MWKAAGRHRGAVRGSAGGVGGLGLEGGHRVRTLRAVSAWLAASRPACCCDYWRGCSPTAPSHAITAPASHGPRTCHRCSYVLVMDPILGTGSSAARAIQVQAGRGGCGARACAGWARRSGRHCSGGGGGGLQERRALCLPEALLRTHCCLAAWRRPAGAAGQGSGGAQDPVPQVRRPCCTRRTVLLPHDVPATEGCVAVPPRFLPYRSLIAAPEGIHTLCKQYPRLKVGAG